MKIPALKLVGRVDAGRQEGQSAVFFPPVGEADGTPLYLRFALVLLGIEQLVLPSVILDDRGHEIKNLGLYSWIHTHGDYFPRAEIFGYHFIPGRGWIEAQFFIRDLELTARWPLFVFQNRREPLASGRPVRTVAWEQTGCLRPEVLKITENLPMPLRRAQASFWQVPPGTTAAELV